jgi:hypothetical protein
MKVNHIIIGAGRSGTTSLVAYLKQHPDVSFSNIKEVTYFSVEDHHQRGEGFLHSFFDRENQITATSDTYLLMDKDAPQRVFGYNPEMKITVILREPGERTNSNFNFSINHGYIDPSVALLASEPLEEGILAKGDIIEINNHCNFYGSLYHHHISNWLNYFNREQLFICTTKQLKEHPLELMSDYFSFLNLKDKKVTELPPQHKAAGVKNKSLNKFLVNRNHPVRRLISKPLQLSFLRNIVLNSNVVEKIKSSNKEEAAYPKLTPEERAYCDNYFKEDLQQLKDEFGIIFS